MVANRKSIRNKWIFQWWNRFRYICFTFLLIYSFLEIHVHQFSQTESFFYKGKVLFWNYCQNLKHFLRLPYIILIKIVYLHTIINWTKFDFVFIDIPIFLISSFLFFLQILAHCFLLMLQSQYQFFQSATELFTPLGRYQDIEDILVGDGCNSCVREACSSWLSASQVCISCSHNTNSSNQLQNSSHPWAGTRKLVIDVLICVFVYILMLINTYCCYS